jgi:hypothetical protein
VLWQLSQWVFLDPIKLREKMPETKDADQISWVGTDIACEDVKG